MFTHDDGVAMAEAINNLDNQVSRMGGELDELTEAQKDTDDVLEGLVAAGDVLRERSVALSNRMDDYQQGVDYALIQLTDELERHTQQIGIVAGQLDGADAARNNIRQSIVDVQAAVGALVEYVFRVESEATRRSEEESARSEEERACVSRVLQRLDSALGAAALRDVVANLTPEQRTLWATLVADATRAAAAQTPPVVSCGLLGPQIVAGECDPVHHHDTARDTIG